MKRPLNALNGPSGLTSRASASEQTGIHATTHIAAHLHVGAKVNRTESSSNRAGAAQTNVRCGRNPLRSGPPNSAEAWALSRRNNRKVGGRQLPNAVHQRLLAQAELEGKVIRQGSTVDRTILQEWQQCLDFGSEIEPPGGLRPIEGLDTEAIPGDEQSFVRRHPRLPWQTCRAGGSRNPRPKSGTLAGRLSIGMGAKRCLHQVRPATRYSCRSRRCK
jgi:hypothetical protein